jgi:hypothetical protein
MKVKLLLENKSEIGEQVKELKRPGLNFTQEHRAILAGSENWEVYVSFHSMAQRIPY